MTLAAPLWLLALLPWAAAVAYLLWGRRRRVDVPFLDLWPSPADGAVRVRRRATPPPLALALALLATLLAILAAGRPAVRVPGAREPLTVIVDRGWAVSAAGALPGRHPAYEEAGRLLGAGQAVDVWMVPPAGAEPVRTNASSLNGDELRDLARPTASDTRDAVRARIRERLGNTTGRVVVFTHPAADVALAAGTEGGRLVQVPLRKPSNNAEIVLLAVRESPAAQAMVRLRASPGPGSAKLRVTSGAATAERDVALPAGSEIDVFVDLPSLDAVVKAELLADDDQAADNVTWLVREASWPRVEARMPLPAHLQRLMETYARQRPPGDASKRVVLVSSVDDAPAGEPAVVLPQVADRASGGRTEAGGWPEVAEHPVTRNLTWEGVGEPPLVGGAPPDGWTPVVRAGGKVWVAVREQPIRAVWVGFDAGDWARSSDYVVFWANVLNWVGTGGERFAAHLVGSFEGAWTAVELAPSAAPPEPMLWPGVYRRPDGTLRAIRPRELPENASTGSDWRERLGRRDDGMSGRVELAPWNVLASLLCLLCAAALWKRKEPFARGRPL